MENLNVCFSGAAKGADTCWAYEARKNGDSVIHFSFSGHKTFDNKDVIVLLNEELEAADSALIVANITLKRRVPEKLEIKNLLRRNFYQIVHTQSIYAISEIDKNGLVKGGTSWAVQMYLDRNKNVSGFLPVYVFDQKMNKWYQFDNDIKKWMNITIPPKPQGLYTGIGTRELNVYGKNAIESVYKQ